MEPAQDPNSTNTSERPRAKLKAALLSVLIILIFIPISIYGVAFFFQFLTAGVFSGNGLYFIGSAVTLIIFLALAYIAGKVFRNKIKTYLGYKSRLFLIVPLSIIVALPILWIIFVQIKVKVATEKIVTEAKSCQNLFANALKINSIVNETHNPGDKFITLEADASVSTPGYITLGYSNKIETYFSLEWLENANGNAFGSPKFLEQGKQNIKIALKLNKKPYYYTNWVEKKSFTIEDIAFSIRNENVCEYPGSGIAYGTYTTKEYLRDDFLSEREKEVGAGGASMVWTDGRQGSVKVMPNEGPTSGGTKVILGGLFINGSASLYPIKNVFFGENPVKNFKFTDNKTGLEVETPPGATGTVDIWIIPNNQYSPTELIKGFTYKN